MVGLLGARKVVGNLPTTKPSNDLLRAFHGSPHDFPPVDMIVNKETGKTYYVETDRFGSYKNHPVVKNNPDGYEFIEHFPQGHFDNSKIGTGEGSQMYGYGGYFAGVEDVAQEYRDRLTPRDLDYEEELYRRYKAAEKNEDYTRMEMLERAMMHDEPKDFRGIAADADYDEDYRQVAADFADEIEELNPNTGKMYEVEIDASPDELLDWDKPLSEQSERTQQAVEKIRKQGGVAGESLDMVISDYGSADIIPGRVLVEMMWGNTPEGVSAMQQQGIKGIRYKDAFSRGTEGGSQNYVIFDDRIINISKKYGIPIPAAAAMLSGQSEEAEAGPIPIASGTRRILDPRFSQPIGGGKVRKGLIDPMATVGAEITPRNIDTGPSFQLSDFEGQPYIISQSDRSAAGGILNAVGGTQIDPVDLRGGRDFMFENPGMAWASDPKVVGSLLERATKLKTDHKQDPLLLPYTMAPTGIDFATMPLDTMINFARSNMSKTNIKKLDEKIKKIIPKWGGVANPGSNAIFRDSTGDQRKMVADVIDKQFKGVKGGLSIAEARSITSDANQYLSSDGSMVNIGRIDVSRSAIADSGHPTYKGGLPGEGVGTFQEPLDIRKFIANNGRVVTNKPNDIRAASMNPALTQGIIDEKLLRSQEGSIDPKLAGRVAAGSAVTAATPTLADQGAGVLDFLANAAQGAIAPIANAPHTILQSMPTDFKVPKNGIPIPTPVYGRSNEQLKADRDARLAQNDYQLRTDLGQQYTQQAQQTIGGLLEYLKQQAERSRILNAAKNSRILQTIPNAFNQIPERGRIVGSALLDSFL